LWPGYREENGPARNSDFVAWKQRVSTLGVDVLDLTDEFWRARNDSSSRLYLSHDTPWSPRGVRLGAERIAARLRPRLESVPSHHVGAIQVTIAEPVDLEGLLGFRREAQAFPSRQVEIRRLAGPIPQVASPPIVLFGDSMSGYYESVAGGLAQQL